MPPLSGIIALDRTVTLFLNGLHTPATDALWLFFSAKPVWYPLYALIAAALFWRLGWKRALVFIAAIILTLVCCDQVSNLFKTHFARLRPCFDPVMVDGGVHILQHYGRYGFFSAHAANAFGLASSTFIALRTDRRLRYRGYAAFIFTWASLVSLSRVFVAMHFFGDILVGAAFGCLFGAIWGHLGRLVARNYIKNKTANATNTTAS